MLGDQVADSVEHEFEVLKNESHDRKFQRTVERCSSLSCSHLRAEQHRRDEFLSLDVNTVELQWVFCCLQRRRKWL